MQKSLEYEELGPKRIAALQKEAEDWRKRAEDAVSSIQDITVSYFVETSKALRGTALLFAYPGLPSFSLSVTLCELSDLNYIWHGY